MKKVTYVLMIFPNLDERSDYLIGYESNTPFGAMSVGDSIRAESDNYPESMNGIIGKIDHNIYEVGDKLSHQTLVRLKG